MNINFREGAPVDVDGGVLADAVSTGHGLQVVLRVPVRVKDDDRVSRGQIDPKPASARRQQEGKVCGAGRIEVLHGLHAVIII